ncbi:MAG TPA: DUF6551 family protein [Actinomycetota bacterium]|nr:DUF6551 family protein [Actinomycetota bacterium]
MATVDELHASSKIEEVELSHLQIDSNYQRDVSERLVDAIVETGWDQVAAELVTVSDRGVREPGGDVRGGLFIVNGQHRSKAAMKIGLTKVWARVINLHDDPDPKVVEARFRLRTNVRLGDRPLERFKAQLCAGDESSTAIVKILSNFGAEINIVPSPDVGINCVSTIEALYRLDDGGLLRETLEVIRDAYGYVGGKNTGANLLKAICWFIEKHADESDRTRLVSKLQGIGLAALETRARTAQLSMAGALWVNYYKAIVELYNSDLREKNRLQWKLRGKSALGRYKSVGAESA